jgi:glutamate-1-semialdehyde 2,1-aminomutase
MVVEAGGAQGEGRGYLPYPIYMQRAHGARMWDVDSNEFIDCHAAFGCVLLGHNHPVVEAAVIDTLKSRGSGFSCAHELEVDLAYKLRDLIPSAEMSAFTCTGTEATYHAIRLARAVTGRNKILKFEGCYHGWHDAVAFSTHYAPEEAAGPVQAPRPVAASTGIAASARNEIIIRSFNDAAGVEAAIAAHGDELAAIIVEPIPINAGLITPSPNFLQCLRELTSHAGILLIFDEVITGLRIAPGSAQEHYGVSPDLTTLGKALGNGLPLSALVGRERYMSRLATAGDVLFSGTHCGHIVNVSAGLAVTELLRGGEVHEHLDSLGRRLAGGVAAAIRETGANARIHQIGSVWVLHFTDGPVDGFRDMAFKDPTGKYAEMRVSYRNWMLTRGIYVHPGFIVRGYLTHAHTEEDVDRIVEATHEFFVHHEQDLAAGG